MEIYFDNAASTKPTKSVAETYLKVMTENFQNPASQSRGAMEAENIIRRSAAKIAALINAAPEEIYFTSGGTEGNNWAIFGTAKGYARSGRHIITTAVEHPAVTAPFKVLEGEGYDVTFLSVDGDGLADVEELKRSIRHDTILVSVIFINNEVGAVQPVEEIGDIIKGINPNIIYHVDAVQGFGKKAVDVKKWKADLITASGHKFHAPKGTGFLYMKNGLKVKPLMYGGGHQRGQRPGTENAAGAAALALAAEESCKNAAENAKNIMEIKGYIASELLKSIPGAFVNGDLEKSSPYVLNIGFEGLRAPVLINALDEKGICVSAGSACSSRKKVQSHVLEAMGLNDDEITGSIRISFSRFSSMDEAEAFVSAVKETVPFLRRFNRKR